MHEGRFTYEEKESQKPDSQISTTVLNALIYEYLIKNSYTGSAKVFKVEGDISNINITQGSSALLDWFIAFNDLYNVRSGRSKPSGITGKIDTILGKVHKEERKRQQVHSTHTIHNKPDIEIPNNRPVSNNILNTHSNIGSTHSTIGSTHSTIGNNSNRWYKDGDILNSILEIDDTQYNRTDQRHTLNIKEIANLRLHTQKINSMSVCHRHKILVTGGMDASICVVDLVNLNDVIRFESHSMQISQVKIRESSGNDPLYFGSASLDREAKVYKISRDNGKLTISLFLSLKGHKSSVKSIDFSNNKIYTMGIDGELRIWGMDGICISAFILRRTIKLMISRDNIIAVCDINSISLFNPDTSSYIKDISSKGIITAYKTHNNNIFILSDSIIIYDKAFYSQSIIPFSCDKIQSVCTVPGRLFLGGYNMIYEVQDKNVYTRAYDGMISAMEGTVIGNRSVLLTGGQNGEVRVWEVPDRQDK
ncbi:hypothetical protein NEPAR04_2094 [Nematocida parisii]|uniref:LisH domain-containing protein n=1 Tax=Nematocida parisii (strain ERTm3) TaxID=935791 RepID=I3EDK5_NEMP3|nr:hypothetical protein NEQG_02425 [Nematocida parisii ERTm3]KAI5129562.1 hypothetical protein NEPAR03_1725 [Nematocida parisii]KAI5130641.1 hypothetical protein NEPAR08_2150 [Nematocida parisii]KAI5143851.1 hypothetical protein NEPAR07_0900 [Nematocida parisii]KAI5144452.1 hypothetical protein NEPAR04_2094 [Nematocida parisii]